MMKNKERKILWLSDIHLKTKILTRDTFEEGYLNDNDDAFVKKMFIAFEDHFTKDDINNIDYVVISGDLAYKGQTESYKLLKKKLAFLNKKPIITVPGNHDVDWSMFEFAFYRDGTDLFDEREKFLENNFPKFKNYFKNYSSVPLGVLSNFTTVSDGYNLNMLNGYLVDDEKKTIFIVINTAWFSVGLSFEEWLADNYKDFDGPKKLFELIRISQEGGNLVTGVNLCNPDIFPTKEILDLLQEEKYKDYCKITIMHHPLDWLSWSEINTYMAGGDNEKAKLYQIINSSDILLTGHTHPANYNQISHACNTLNFSAPLFLSHKGKFENLTSDHGFVILTVSEDNKFSKEYYQYNIESGFGIIDEKSKLTKNEKIRTFKNSGKELITVKYSEINSFIKKKFRLGKEIVVSNPYKRKKISCYGFESKKNRYSTNLFIYLSEEFVSSRDIIEILKKNNTISIDSIEFIKFESDLKFLSTKSERMSLMKNEMNKIRVELFNNLETESNEFRLSKINKQIYFDKLVEVEFINRFFESTHIE